MITAKELNYIKTNAYIPEHILSYVGAVSGAEPHLLKTFLCYKKSGTLIFIGYPLGEPFEEKKMLKALDRAIKQFGPDEIALIAPAIPGSIDSICREKQSDAFYRLDIGRPKVSQKVRNMIGRASRELSLDAGHE